jgi:peptide deformylase
VRERQLDGNSITIIRGEGKSSRNKNQDGIFLVNPRIIKRSPESEMLVWTEECLVLPPEFRATLLRDASVTIEYEALGADDCGITKQITLNGELARCAQHEMDHDRGVLIVDHVSLAELLSINDDDFMASIEDADGLHEARIQRA